jgi:hypothetical protein
MVRKWPFHFVLDQLSDYAQRAPSLVPSLSSFLFSPSPRHSWFLVPTGPVSILVAYVLPKTSISPTVLPDPASLLFPFVQ